MSLFGDDKRDESQDKTIQELSKNLNAVIKNQNQIIQNQNTLIKNNDYFIKTIDALRIKDSQHDKTDAEIKAVIQGLKDLVVKGHETEGDRI